MFQTWISFYHEGQHYAAFADNGPRILIYTITGENYDSAYIWNWEKEYLATIHKTVTSNAFEVQECAIQFLSERSEKGQ